MLNTLKKNYIWLLCAGFFLYAGTTRIFHKNPNVVSILLDYLIGIFYIIMSFWSYMFPKKVKN